MNLCSSYISNAWTPCVHKSYWHYFWFHVIYRPTVLSPCSNSSVSTVTRLWTGQSGVRFTRRGKVFLFSTTFRLALGTTPLLVQWGTGVIAPWVKWLGSEAEHSPPSSVKVKNGWSYTTTPHMHLHGIYRGNLLHYTSLLLYILYFPTSSVSCNNDTQFTLTKIIYRGVSQPWIVCVWRKETAPKFILPSKPTLNALPFINQVTLFD